MFSPCNRYLLLDPIEEEDKEETSILLPEDYKEPARHGAAKVMGKSLDCTIGIELGDTVVYPTNTIENISFNKKEYYLILENFVLGVINED